MTPSQFAHEACIVRPLKGMTRDEPLDERLVILRDPVPRKVAPVAVEPLKYSELTTFTVPDAVVTSITVGVLNEKTDDSTPPCPFAVK